MEEGRVSAQTGTILRVVDAIALVLFVLVGIRSHYGSEPSVLFLRNAVPLLVAWFVVAVPVGTYRRPSPRSLVMTWVLAVPIGLVARSFILGSPTGSRLATFLGVGLAFTLVFLVAGRLLAALIERRVFPVDPST